jgi:aminomethyltransferase
MEQIKRTAFFDQHIDLNARMVDFSGWQMPIQYTEGIVAEHLATRKHAGLFDVSHMGRFLLYGSGRKAFLRHVLTNDCNNLAVGQAHYTMLANKSGGAIDDAFLYRPSEDTFILVVNASNKDKDWEHLQNQLAGFSDLQLEDMSDKSAMLALQGPQSEAILKLLITEGTLPGPKRNTVGTLKLCGVVVTAARTGYTGEPVCFELFLPPASAGVVWDKLIVAGAKPMGLGARDTLRLEAGLPLYGHELGTDKDGCEIPIFAISQAPFAVSFDDPNRRFIGRAALEKQAAARQRYKDGDFSDTTALPKVVRQIQLLEKGIARDGAVVYYEDIPVGRITSGTMVPYWEIGQAQLDHAILTDAHSKRAVGLCLVQPQVTVGSEIQVEVRGRKLKARVAPRNLENRTGNTTHAIM